MPQIEEAARKYAIETTHTRCAYMGTETCTSCKKSDRGYCDYRTRYESYMAGIVQSRRSRNSTTID